MASAVVGLIPLLAAGEPSKVPFYVAGALLVVWAILLALVGLRSAEFPGSSRLGPGVLAVSALLVVGVMSTAVITASKPAKATEAAAPKPRASTGTAPSTTTAQPATSGAASGTVSLAADPSGQLKYDAAALSAKAGKVTVDFTNASPVPHNVTIQRGGKNLAATKTFANGKASVSTTLRPGVYTFLCTVDSHAQAGMKGTLTIK